MTTAEPLRTFSPSRVRAYRAWAPMEPGGNVPRLWDELVEDRPQDRPTDEMPARAIEIPRARGGLGVVRP